MGAGRSKHIAGALGVLLLVAIAILVLLTFFPTATAPPAQHAADSHEHDHEHHSPNPYIPDRIFKPEPALVEVHGTVYEPDGSVAVGVEVKATRAELTLAVARTDKEGTYSLEQVTAGQTTLTASTPEYPTLSELIWLRPDKSHVKADLRFKGTGEIFGVVRDYERGFPLRGAEVKLDAHKEKKVFSTESDENGAYSFKNLPRGEYGLSARFEGYSPYFTSGTLTIMLDKEKMRHDIELEVSFKISGTVTDPEGNPVEGASITFEGWAARTNARGYYEMDIPPSLGFRTKDEDEDLPPRFVVLTVKARGFAPATPDPIQVVPGDWIRCDVRLSRGGRVYGTVVDEDGNPLKGVKMILIKYWYNQHVFYETAITGPDGKYEIRHTGAGKHVVQAAPPEMPPKFEEIELKEDEEKQADFTLEKLALIEGVVTDPEDQPVAGVKIRAQSSRHGWAQAVSGNDGRFKLSGLQPDKPYRLWISKDGYQTLRFKKVLSGTEPLVIKLQQATGLSGRVTLDSIGQRGVNVYMWIDPSLRWAKTTGEDGKFEFKDMNPAKYQIVAETEGYRSEVQAVEIGAGKAAAPVELKLKPVK